MKQFNVYIYPLSLTISFRCLRKNIVNPSRYDDKPIIIWYQKNVAECLHERAIENLLPVVQKRSKNKERGTNAYVPHVGDFRDLTHCSLWVEHDCRSVIYTVTVPDTRRGLWHLHEKSVSSPMFFLSSGRSRHTQQSYSLSTSSYF